jgi:hypothetical protein
VLLNSALVAILFLALAFGALALDGWLDGTRSPAGGNAARAPTA